MPNPKNSNYSKNVALWIAFPQLLPFSYDAIIHHNIYIGVGYFVAVVNDNFCGLFDSWVHSVSLSDPDETQNPVEYDGFRFVHDMYRVQ